jgi:hypothetical protein
LIKSKIYTIIETTLKDAATPITLLTAKYRKVRKKVAGESINTIPIFKYVALKFGYIEINESQVSTIIADAAQKSSRKNRNEMKILPRYPNACSPISEYVIV